jgi:DNA replication protein DnaC
LVNALEQEKAQNRAGKIAEMLVKTDLLVLDELGYLPFSTSGGAMLFHLLSKLYERTSVILLGVCCAKACQATHHYKS